VRPGRAAAASARRILAAAARGAGAASRAAAGAARRAAARTGSPAAGWAFGCAAAVSCGFFALLAVGAGRAVLVSPPPTPIIEDREGNFLTEGAGLYESFGYWDIEGPLNRRVVECLVAVEDRRFWSHPGVDPVSMARSALSNLAGNDRQGGSTIAMQVARLEYPAERTPWNKTLEMSTAFFLVRRFGREQVMRQYLKLVPQGNQVHGVAYAARRFLHKPLQDVTLAEAALLAALPREPGRMNVFAWTGFQRARERAGLILTLLERRRVEDPEEVREARRELAAMTIPVREMRPTDCYHYVLRLLADEKAAGRPSYSGPIRSSLDPGAQELAADVVSQALAENARLDVHAMAAIVAERDTGEVIAYVGSGSFFDEENAGSIDYARAPRSSGSSLKPLLFALGLDTGRFTPASVLPDLPFALVSPQGEYHAANFDDAYLGPMLYRRALANSRNVPALRVLEGVGMEEFLALMTRMGVARDESHDASYYGYGLAIGGLYVSLSDLVAAYAALANDGRESPLRFRHGGERQAAPRRFFSAYAAREVGLFLSDNTARLPSFPRMSVLEYPFPVAVKTGTSQGYRDAWTVAWSSRYIVGVWMGNPDNHPMNRVAGLLSAGYAARIMRSLHPLQVEGIDAAPLPTPEGAEPVRICILSGEAAGPDCTSTLVEQFRPGEAPRGLCSVHRRFAVDTRDGSPATASTPPRRVALRPFTVLPAIYALWGARHGYGDMPVEAEPAGETALSITYPHGGSRYFLDPDTPARFQTLSLEASVSPRVRAVEWRVDGKPLQRSPFPYSARLPLTPGRHVIQAVVPGTGEASGPVSISVE
jgi:penicillin-binding protein 1C